MKKKSLLFTMLIVGCLSFAQSTTTIRSTDGTLLLNGQPFFSVGVYNLRTAPGWTQDLNDAFNAGFNVFFMKITSSTVQADATALLNLAQSKGMYVWIEADAFNANPSTTTANLYVNPYKNHPALFGWIIGDDVHANMTVAQLQTRQDVLKANDPNHVTLSTGYNTPYLPYMAITDINGMYNYPVYKANSDLNSVDYYISWARVNSSKPIWGIVQAYKWSGGSNVPPSATQYRNMSYQYIISNVKGYLPYIWYESSDSYLPNFAMFSEAQLINADLKGELVQAIMNGTYTRCNTGVNNSTAGVKAASWLDYDTT